ncbi:hypothetical protein JRO89_XS01G0320700 [Xanthoceras sorbifolium]|uniref:Protein kinase domain-containing protein n=1 Tax=Xanthoceras sorbifolium TaxID=99658 RepID=A0ABQ8INI8_9ROSI|nr:hypothetical protein JRO89_XS01G0320700 [Xanthoceras sorbifolium]
MSPLIYWHQCQLNLVLILSQHSLEHAKIRKMMRDHCNCKVPGSSWMEITGGTHSFVSSSTFLADPVFFLQNKKFKWVSNFISSSENNIFLFCAAEVERFPLSVDTTYCYEIIMKFCEKPPRTLASNWSFTSGHLGVWLANKNLLIHCTLLLFPLYHSEQVCILQEFLTNQPLIVSQLPAISTSSYSDASTVRKSTKNPVAVAARSVAGFRFKIRLNNKESGNVQFTMDEIYMATRNFSPSFKIGQGGFGTVYKGRLEDGTTVAIKRAKKVTTKHLGVEFQSEIKTLARVEHLNLVKFYGCLEYQDERIVVMEYVPNGTLREHLDCLHGNILDLAARLDIAVDVAHAVTYLHMYTGFFLADYPSHFSFIKSFKVPAKVTDFGFARLAADAESGATHVSTQVKGTAGYLDPEYLRTYQLTEKSDVYSFGVLLVELITGRRPIESKRELKERITARWVRFALLCFVHFYCYLPSLVYAANNLALEKVFELALQCLAPHRQNRPSMRRCAEILWSIRKDYRELVDVRLLTSHSQRSTSVREK